MSSQDEDGRSLDKGSEGRDDVSTKPKIQYSREFLLSIGNLDICKKLPSRFEESLTSELEDALLRIPPDRPRIPGSLPFQGFRRNEHASSPPTRGEPISYYRGKWESRSSARNDRDNDSQSDRDSDSARRYGNHSRRSWQTPEHDGLLGSGSFPRSSGYAAGISTCKVRANETNQLSRSIEPYHPPRPYKAVPHTRKDTDAFNDETFGSLECTSEDRAEQERRRRASFEMMRKEQHKALQEKQSSNLEKHKAGGISNLSEVLADSKEEKGLLGRNNEVGVSAVSPLLSNDLEKSSFGSHASAPRPLIPPGFKNNPLEKVTGFKSLVHPSPSGVGKPVSAESSVDAGTNLIPNANDALESQLSQEISLVDGQPAEKTQHGLLFNKGENVNMHTGLDVPINKPGIEDQLFQISSQLDSHGPQDDHGITEINAEALEDKTVHDSSRSHSTSILEKIFGSALSVNDGQFSSAELHDVKPDDTWSPDSAHSSKFAQWFSEEAKAVDGISSSRENDILSLIVSGDKNQVSGSEVAKLPTHDVSYKTSKKSTQVKLDMPSGVDGLSGQARANSKEEAIPTVLTCEDLEQTILSEFGVKTTDMQPDLKSWSATGGSTAQPSAHVDNNASLHLLSMLQKSTDQSNTTVNSVNVNLADKHLVSKELGRAAVVNEPKGEENGKIVSDLGKTLTLEALFGTAFMQELQSVEAPVSVQRGPEPHGLPFPVSDNDISSPAIGRSGLARPSHDQSVSSNDRQHTKLSGAENWRFDDSQIGITSPKRRAETLNHVGFERGAEFQLPEEDNLISVGNTRDPRMLSFMSTGNSMNVNPSSSPPINIMEKLAAFGGAVKDKHSMEGSENLPPFARDSYQQMQPDISYHNLQLHQQSSPHFQPPQMSQGRPLFHHLESDPAHMSSQLKFLRPEPMLNHESPTNHPFSSNIIRPSFHQPNVRVSGFDVPSQHPMLHHMQMPGNHPPPHFARGSPVPQHANQTTGFLPEMNQMQGFPGPRQPSISGGVPMPGNPPEAFQRLIEMELRANSKEIHPPFSPPVHGQGGMFGHEVDMAFRYR